MTPLVRAVLSVLLVLCISLGVLPSSGAGQEYNLVLRGGRVMDALARMTILPARRLEGAVPAMRWKGRIRIGADADVVVFDPATIIDRATFAEPATPSAGIRHVLVNGVSVVRDGELPQDARPGRAVRRSALLN